MLSRRSAVASVAAALAWAGLAPGSAAQSSPSAPPLAALDDDPALVAAIGGPQRTATNRARDGWRHPLQTLGFWGIAPGLTVIDIDPGGGYWTEVLAPYLAQGGGRYLAGMADPADPATSDRAREAHAAFASRFGDQARYGSIGYLNFSAVGLDALPASADMVILSRVIHGLIRTPGELDKDMADFYAVLRPGGVLAIEEHRADPRAMAPGAVDGYVSEDFVIAAATRAGFGLQARSEINANPKDSKDHPFGVWTLPPTRRSAPEGQPANPAFDHARYDAIGESDRMTLRLAKAP